MPTNCVFQPKVNFLEMAHTNFVSSIRITSYQPFVLDEKKQRTCFRNLVNLIFQKFPKLYFQICSYIQKITVERRKEGTLSTSNAVRARAATCPQ